MDVLYYLAVTALQTDQLALSTLSTYFKCTDFSQF